MSFVERSEIPDERYFATSGRTGEGWLRYRQNLRSSAVKHPEIGFQKPKMGPAVLFILALAISGCSGGVARTSEVQISASDMRQSDISRANMFLDNIQKMPESSRQMAANAPAAAEALAKGAQADTGVKQRIESLGLTVPVETAGRRIPHR